VSLTARDRKILILLVPVAIIAAYWFLMLAPKREEATLVQDKLTQAQAERDTAVSRLAQLTVAKKSFADDYATVIYLGKSVPSDIDMPSLLVQLDRAARGTGIRFTSASTGDREGAPASGSATPPADGATNTDTSTSAQSDPGKAGEAAQSATDTANQASANSAAAAGGTPTTAAGGAAAPGLESIPLTFEFSGSFFDLADFFHRMKRFVRVANDRIIVRGRLMTINSFKFDAKEAFPNIVATVDATVYLAPKAEGVSAGATPQGPAGAPPADTGGQTASTSPTPAATVTAP
jgi:Tfp pilus assembly protein PilO